MPTVLSMRHTGLVVRDLPHSIDFYTRVLGLKAPVVVLEQGAFLEHALACPGVAVTTAKFQAMQGECMLELLYFASPESTPSSPKEYPFYRFGPTHVAFTVSGLDALLEEVDRAGGSRLSDPISSVDGKVRVAFCRAPEGNLLELVEAQEA